jgi:hypothetical protein
MKLFELKSEDVREWWVFKKMGIASFMMLSENSIKEIHGNHDKPQPIYALAQSRFEADTWKSIL